MRLIDADAALRSLSDDLPYKDSVRRVLTQAPTVDAVQVTRCKDCLDFDMASGFCQCHSQYYDGGMCWDIFRDDDFCSYGRPKEAHHAEPED